jgi:hypothetical protein
LLRSLGSAGDRHSKVSEPAQCYYARIRTEEIPHDVRQGSLAWLAGALVLFAMWLYFALRILLLI